jgi:UDP-N-acetylmuramate--alanine ligase
MIGIGGSNMSALSRVLMDLKFKVSGSDTNVCIFTKKLIEDGVKISSYHSAENIEKPDLICYSAAISQNNPELIEARRLNIPIFERSELLGEIIKMYKFPIAVSGTHGKTTTTSMLANIMICSSLDPTVMVGGYLSEIDGNLRLGSKEFLIFEACEYVESFLKFNSYSTIITNVEEDHLDYYSDINHIISSFKKFINLNSKNGVVVACGDDENVLKILQYSDKKILKFGIKNENCDFLAKKIIYKKEKGLSFSIFKDKNKLLDLEVGFYGMHNIYNSLAAATMAYSLGIDERFIKISLEKFEGVERRFQKIAEINGILLFDDYAHHPTEVKATLEMAKNMSHNKLWCIFQPHMYSRTKMFFNWFASTLSIADIVIITDIYAAREKENLYEIHSKDLVSKIKNSLYMRDFEEISEYVLSNANANDIVITMGAGNVNEICKIILEKTKIKD